MESDECSTFLTRLVSTMPQAVLSSLLPLPTSASCTPPQSPPLKHSRAAWAGLKTVGRRTPIRKLSTSSCRSRAREARLRQAGKSGAERPVLDRPRRFPLNHHSRVLAITWRDAKLCFKLDAKLYSRKLDAKFDIKL